MAVALRMAADEVMVELLSTGTAIAAGTPSRRKGRRLTILKGQWGSGKGPGCCSRRERGQGWRLE